MEWIPTLEYHQMAGRAGRPDFNDEYGEAICIADSDKDVEAILERFINAPPEKIFSKLAVEPALRSYCLSLIATGFAKSKQELSNFFEKTFYGKQYGDTPVVTVTNSVECNAEEMLISCREYDYGLGIALFKYFGTSDAQWEAARQYGDLIKAQVIGDEPPSDETIRQILMRVYEKYPPKNPHLLKWKPRPTV